MYYYPAFIHLPYITWSWPDSVNTGYRPAFLYSLHFHKLQLVKCRRTGHNLYFSVPFFTWSHGDHWHITWPWIRRWMSYLRNHWTWVQPGCLWYEPCCRGEDYGRIPWREMTRAPAEVAMTQRRYGKTKNGDLKRNKTQNKQMTNTKDTEWEIRLRIYHI